MSAAATAAAAVPAVQHAQHTDEVQVHQLSRRPWHESTRRRAAAVAVLFGVAAVATCTRQHLPRRSQIAASAGTGQRAFAALRLGERRLSSPHSEGGLHEVIESPTERRLQVSELPSFTYDPLSEGAQGLAGMPTGYDGLSNSNSNGQSPTAGNSAATPGCGTNEEEFGGECYKTCASLTNNTYNNRVAAGACCKATGVSCMLPSNVKVSGFLPGSGFLVSGDGGNPHQMGLCDGNEELHAGMCYKKCSVLTSNKYPIRSAANTCCEKLPCLWGLSTEGTVCSGHGVGGGQVPAHECPHAPQYSAPTTA